MPNPRVRLYADIRACVTLDAPLRTQEIQTAAGRGGARFSLGLSDGSSMRGDGDSLGSPYVWTNIDAVVDPLITARAWMMPILGTDFPRWSEIHDEFADPYAEVNRPSSYAFPYWCEDHGAFLDRIISKLVTAGLNPPDYLFPAMTNEACRNGAGGPYDDSGPGSFSAPYAALSGGTYEQASDIGGSGRNFHAQMLYMATNLDKRGLSFVGPSLETQSSDFTQELATIGNGSCLSYVDIPAFNHYATFTYGTSATLRRAVRAYYDSILTTKAAIVAAVPSWASKRFALTEFGATLSMLKWGSGQVHKQKGHSHRGEFLLALMDRLETCGEFSHVSLYATRDRTRGAADSALWGLQKYDGTYTYAWRSFGARAGVTGAQSMPPSGSYSGASGEAVGA